MPRPPIRLTVAVALAYALILAAVVFWPTPVDGGHQREIAHVLAQPQSDGLRLLDYTGIETAANVLLFVPLGLIAALHLSGRRAWLAVLLGAVASASIETVQLLLLPQRHADPQDVLANTAGAAIGALLGVVLRRGLPARRRRRAAAPDGAPAQVPRRRPPA